MERDVADDDVRVERMTGRIADLDAHTGQRLSEPMHPVLVDVDRRDGPAELSQRAGEGTITASQFEDRARGAPDEGGDAGEGRAVGEEVLAEFVTAAMD